LFLFEPVDGERHRGWVHHQVPSQPAEQPGAGEAQLQRLENLESVRLSSNSVFRRWSTAVVIG